MAVLINDIAQLEYDRDKVLTDYQQTYLDSMDKKMDDGISIDGIHIENPDMNQKIQFVAANLLEAMKTSNEGMTSALCTYIAMRLPDLKQVKITDNEGEVTIDLVFDEKYSKQTAVQFTHH
jgi:hypothetical protein